MGSGASQSMINEETKKPLDCSDLKTQKEAMDEIIRLRKLMAEHHTAAAKIAAPSVSKVGATAAHTASQFEAMSSPTRRVPRFSKFNNDFARAFKLEQSPTLHEYLINEYNRFCGDSGGLDWDQFWRCLVDLDLGLTDGAIASLRQECDANTDGLVDWEEMVSALEPLLGKHYAAQLEQAPEFARWCGLHWEVHHVVKEDHEGYSKCERPFWVNKVTGESSWVVPQAVKDFPEIAEAAKAKKLRKNALAPSLPTFLDHVFRKHCAASAAAAAATTTTVGTPTAGANADTSRRESVVNGRLRKSAFLRALSGELHMSRWLTAADWEKVSTLAKTADAASDLAGSKQAKKKEKKVKEGGGGGKKKNGKNQKDENTPSKDDDDDDDDDGGGGDGGVVSWTEFMHFFTPLLAEAFTRKPCSSNTHRDWIALETFEGDGMYLYYYNRITGESAWKLPPSAVPKKKS